MKDSAGNLWIGTADAGVWRYDGESLINYTPADGLPDCAIETIYLDKQDSFGLGRMVTGYINSTTVVFEGPFN